MKFLRLENGTLLNVNEVTALTNGVYSHKQYKAGEVVRKMVAEIVATTRDGLQVVARTEATAPSTEEEEWETGTEKCEKAEREISEILDVMVTILVDKMNDEHEKIIDIGTRFLEEAMQEEVEKGQLMRSNAF